MDASEHDLILDRGQGPVKDHPSQRGLGQQAQHNVDPLYRPEWEAELLDISRIHAYLAQGHWFRLVSSVGTFSLGGHIYYLKHTWAGQQVEIAFDPDDLQFVVYSDDGQHIKRFFPKGITTDDLMGEMSPLANLPAFQLALPFSWQDWRRARLSGTLMGTT